MGGPDGRERQALVPDGVEPGQTFTVQDDPPMVQFEVAVPEGCKEGEIMTFVLPDGRPKTTHVPTGMNAGDKFPVVIPAPVLFPVVVPEGKKAGDEIEYNGPDGIEEGTFNTVVYPSSSMDVKVEIPEGKEAGQEFQFPGPNGVPLTTSVPEGKKAGDTIVVSVPRIA